MIEGIPKISVLLITYKQEELIKRAIDSLLNQKDYIYEICVSDDCSPDSTWKVIQEYYKQYPGLFKLHRNETNVGIFENVEYTWTMPTGEIIYQLSGDDECGEGWFKTVIRYIKDNSIDYKDELFCIYGDYKALYPNGDYYVMTNRAVTKYPAHSLSMSIRGVICSRGCCYNIKILNKYKRVSKGRSYIAEDAQDRQLQLYSEKVYYIPHIGNIYYARIGVCKNMSQTDISGRKDIFRYSYDFIKKNGVLNKRDSYYLIYKDALLHFNRSKFIFELFKIFNLRLRSLILIFDLRPSFFMFILFSCLRRIPHKDTLSMIIR